MNKREILDLPTIVIYSDGLCGVEIKAIEYGIDDYILCVSHYGEPKCHRLKIYDSYFNLYRRRINLDDCLRMEV